MEKLSARRVEFPIEYVIVPKVPLVGSMTPEIAEICEWSGAKWTTYHGRSAWLTVVNGYDHTIASEGDYIVHDIDGFVGMKKDEFDKKYVTDSTEKKESE